MFPLIWGVSVARALTVLGYENIVLTQIYRTFVNMGLLH